MPPQNSEYRERMMAAAMEARRRAEEQEALLSSRPAAEASIVSGERFVDDAEVAKQQKAERKAKRQETRAKKAARRAKKQQKEEAKASAERAVPSIEKPDGAHKNVPKSFDRHDRHASNSSKKRKRVEPESAPAAESETSEPTPPPKKVKTKKSTKKSSTKAVDAPQEFEPAVANEAEMADIPTTRKVKTKSSKTRISKSPASEPAVVSGVVQPPPSSDKPRKKKKKKPAKNDATRDASEEKPKGKRKKHDSDKFVNPETAAVVQDESKAKRKSKEKRSEPSSHTLSRALASHDTAKGRSDPHSGDSQSSTKDHEVAPNQHRLVATQCIASKKASIDNAASAGPVAKSPAFQDSQSVSGFSRRIGPFIEDASPPDFDGVSIKDESAGESVDNDTSLHRGENDDEADATFNPAAGPVPQDPDDAIAEHEWTERMADWTHHQDVLKSFLQDNADCEPDEIVTDPEYGYDTSDYEYLSGVDDEPDDEDLPTASPTGDNDDIFGFQLCVPTPDRIAAARQAKRDGLHLCRYPIFEVTPWTIFLRTWSPLENPRSRSSNTHLNASQRSAQDCKVSEHDPAHQPGDVSAVGPQGEACQSQQRSPSIVSLRPGSQAEQPDKNFQPSQPSRTASSTPAFQTQDMGRPSKGKQRSPSISSWKGGFVAVNRPQPQRSNSNNYPTLSPQQESQDKHEADLAAAIPNTVQRQEDISTQDVSQPSQDLPAPTSVMNSKTHRSRDSLYPDGIHHREATETQKSQPPTARVKSATSAHRAAATTEQTPTTPASGTVYLIFHIARSSPYEPPQFVFKGSKSSAFEANQYAKQVWYKDAEGEMYDDMFDEMETCGGVGPPEGDGFLYKGETEDGCLWWKGADAEGAGVEVRVRSSVVGEEGLCVEL